MYSKTETRLIDVIKEYIRLIYSLTLLTLRVTVHDLQEMSDVQVKSDSDTDRFKSRKHIKIEIESIIIYLEVRMPFRQRSEIQGK